MASRRPIGVTIADHIASLNLVAGILAALLARGRTGRGQRVDVSLLGSQIWAQASEYTYHLTTGDLPGRPNGSHPLIPASTASCPPPTAGWPSSASCRRSGLRSTRPSAGPTSSTTPASPARSSPPPRSPSCSRCSARSSAPGRPPSGAPSSAAAGQRFAPVRTYADVVADPQVWANDYLAEVDGANRGDADPAERDAHPRRHRPPDVGADTMDVLLEAGYSDDEIAALVTDRTV